MAQVLEITDANFQAEVLDCTTPVLVDFWGPNCAPCKAIAPQLHTLADELEGKVKVVKVNIHANMRTAMNYKIMSIPTFVVVQGGREVNRQQGTAGGIASLRKLVGRHI